MRLKSIALSDGTTLGGVWGNEHIEEHPDTGNRLAGLTIPAWDSFLRLAARCYEMTGLGYLGIDIVLDKDLGPLLLELNARPGLNIQIANNGGLLKRCDQIVAHAANRQEKAEERVRFSKQAFDLANPGAEENGHS